VVTIYIKDYEGNKASLGYFLWCCHECEAGRIRSVCIQISVDLQSPTSVGENIRLALGTLLYNWPNKSTQHTQTQLITTHNTQYTTHNTQHTTHNTQHTTHNTQHTTHNKMGRRCPPSSGFLLPSHSMATSAMAPNHSATTPRESCEGARWRFCDCRSWFPCLGHRNATHQEIERGVGPMP
jgi:hypothetical protein